MLKMLLKGVPVNYNPDIALNLIYENPFFYNDRIPSTHSLNFELPATRHNLNLFLHPNRINTYGAFKEYDGFDIYFSTVKILTGVLVVQEFEKNIKCFFRGSVITDEMRKSLPDVEMEQFNFGGERDSHDFYSTDFYGYFYRETIQGTLSNPDAKFVAPPVAVKDIKWPRLENQAIVPEWGGNLAANLMYFNFFNARDEEYMLFDDVNTAHTIVFPAVKIWYIFDHFFGNSLDQNPFASGDLKRLTLLSTFHPRWKERMGYSGYQSMLLDVYPSDLYENEGYFYLNSFLPQLPANDLIKESLKLICHSLYPAGNRFRVRSNEAVLAGTDSVNWSGKQIGRLTLSDQEGQTYTYGYAEAVPDINPSDYDNVVSTIHQMFQYPMGGEEDLEIYVTSTKEAYKKILREKANSGTPDRFDYELIGSAMGRGEGTSGFEMKSNMVPVTMSIKEYWADHYDDVGIKFGSWYVPVWEGDRLLRPDKLHIGLFHGLQDTHTELPGGSENNPNRYPLMAPHNYNAYGERQGGLSLEWEGPYGLINLYHRAYMNYMQAKKKKVSSLFTLSALDIKNMDMSKKVHLRGVNFLIEKIELTIRQRKMEPASIDLIESDIEGIFDGHESADSSGGGIGPELGDCYTIEIDTEVFDTESQTLTVQRQRPGAEQEERSWNSYFYTQEGFIITVAICSVSAPVLKVDGILIDPILGVTVNTGGTCSSDATCLS